MSRCYKPLVAAGSKTLVLFAHYDPDNRVDPYVTYYLRALHQLDAEIVFVSSSEPDVTDILGLCRTVYTASTPSTDFASWRTGWNMVCGSIDQFDRLVLANDSVYGPLFPLTEMWGQFDGADMYGAIESNEITRHFQSWFLAWDLNERTIPFLHQFWVDLSTADAARVRGCEIALSARAIAAGLTMRPFVSAAQADVALGAAPNQTISRWDGLIDQFRFPFLKRRVVFDVRPRGLDDFLRERTDYPTELLEGHRERCSSAAAKINGLVGAWSGMRH